MANTIYSAVAVFVDGNLLSEESTVSLNFDSGKQPVKSVQKGLAGYSVGSRMITGSFDLNIPVDAFELDPSVMSGKPDFHTFDFIAGGKTLSTTGWFDNSTISHGVDAASKSTLNFTCNYAEFK